MKEKERNAGLKFCKDCKFLLSSENKKTNICIIHQESLYSGNVKLIKEALRALKN